MLYWVPSSPSCFVGLCWVTIHFNCSPFALWFMPRKSWPNPYHQLFINSLYRRYRSIPTNHSPFTCQPPHVFFPSGNAGAQSDSCYTFIESWMGIHVKGDTDTWFVPGCFRASFGCVVFGFFCRGSRRCLYIMNYAHKHMYIYIQYIFNKYIKIYIRV